MSSVGVGDPGFQMIRMIEWGQKSTPPPQKKKSLGFQNLHKGSYAITQKET